jgi:hypothetical protein
MARNLALPSTSEGRFTRLTFPFKSVAETFLAGVTAKIVPFRAATP